MCAKDNRPSSRAGCLLVRPGYPFPMHIEWNRVTWYSQVVAIMLFFAIFALGFYLGQKHNTDVCEYVREIGR